jgi:hypothetical protein
MFGERIYLGSKVWWFLISGNVYFGDLDLSVNLNKEEFLTVWKKHEQKCEK